MISRYENDQYNFHAEAHTYQTVAIEDVANGITVNVPFHVFQDMAQFVSANAVVFENVARIINEVDTLLDYASDNLDGDSYVWVRNVLSDLIKK